MHSFFYVCYIFCKRVKKLCFLLDICKQLYYTKFMNEKDLLKGEVKWTNF